MEKIIIDAHTHIGKGHLINANPKDLLKSMKTAGIDRACVFAGELNNCSTEELLNSLSKYHDVLYPIGSVSPLSEKRPSLDQVEKWLLNNDIYGLKFYPGYEFFYPYDECARPYLELLAKYGRPAIFHSGDTYNKVAKTKLRYAHPLEIDELASELPDLKIIIAHFGNPWVIDTAEVCLKNKNVYADSSGIVYNTFLDEDKKLFKYFLETFMRYTLTHTSFGKRKLIFGTDWPISNQSDYVVFMNTLFEGEAADDFFWKNAKEVFNLE